MRSATAQISGERLANRRLRWIGISIKKRFSGHDHSIDAISALRSLHLNECRLDGMRLGRSAQAFQGRDLSSCRLIGTNRTRTDRLPLHDHGASSTLAQAATKLRSVQLKIVSKHIE